MLEVMRRTKAQLSVAAVMLANPESRFWGYELSKASGVRSGVMYPMLSRWLEQGWLSDGWDAGSVQDRQLPRRFYELTESGRAALGALVINREHGEKK